MHELVHYRRGDLFLHHALLLICYLHWYNPVVWLAFASSPRNGESVRSRGSRQLLFGSPGITDTL